MKENPLIYGIPFTRLDEYKKILNHINMRKHVNKRPRLTAVWTKSILESFYPTIREVSDKTRDEAVASRENK